MASKPQGEGVKTKTEPKNTKARKDEKRFSKMLILNSDMFRRDQYILQPLLHDEKKYTFEEVFKILEDYRNKEV